MTKRLLPTIIAVAALVSAAYTLTLVDQLLQGTLFSYGLVFSYDWANPYWTLLRVTWALLAISAAAITINTISIIRSISKEKQQSVEVQPTRRVEEDIRPTFKTKKDTEPATNAPELRSSQKVAPKPTSTTAPAPPPSHASPEARLFKCTHCGKAFTQPLRMLNFQVDPPRIMNVCPFCNETMPAGPTAKESEQTENRSYFRKSKDRVQKALTQ